MAAEVSNEGDQTTGFSAARLTPHLEELLRGRGPDDPLVVQFRVGAGEEIRAAGEVDDPIGDAARSPVPGVVHRYPDRVLLIPHHHCAAYCRFCFRRERVGRGDGGLSDAEIDAALDYIRAHPEIREVVLSGGDPLVAAPARIARMTRDLATVPHLDIVRVHTRLTTSAPERVTPELVAALRAGGKPVWVAVHVNHPDEIGPATRAAFARLVDAGVPLVGQTVLLRGVNDDPAVLTELFRSMVRERVKPYYLHHLDHAPGTSRFRVSLERGREIADALVGNLSGLCRPLHVLDLPGGFGKVPAGRSWVETVGDEYRVRDYKGAIHSYRD